MDQMESVRDTGRCVSRYEYNPDGTVCRLIDGDSLYTECSYDLDKNLTGLKTMLGEEVLADNHYRHDGNGNTVEKRQPGGLTKDSHARYEYDSFNRTAKVETFDGNIQVNRYDPEGLRHEMEENGRFYGIFRFC